MAWIIRQHGRRASHASFRAGGSHTASHPRRGVPRAGEREEVSPITGHRHPVVSEVGEGKPWFESLVALGVLASALLALLGHVTASTAVLAAVSFVCATLRVFLRGRSPWKVRSTLFDTLIGYGLAVGLPLTLLAVQLIER